MTLSAVAIHGIEPAKQANQNGRISLSPGVVYRS
jgi:hypothetical protein